MKLKDAEDLLITCLVEAPAYLDPLRVSERHLSDRGKRLFKAVKVARSEGYSIVPENELIRLARVDEHEVLGILRRIGKIDTSDRGTLEVAESQLIKAWAREQKVRIYRQASILIAEKGVEEGEKEMARQLAEIGNLSEVGDTAWRTPLEVMDQHLNNLAKRLQSRNEGNETTIRSGFSKIDEITGFWAPKRKTIIGANTSVGKSTLMCQLLLGMAMKGVPVAHISLEDPTEMTVERMLSWIADAIVQLKRLKGGDYTLEDIQEVRMMAHQVFEKLPLYLFNCPSANVGRVSKGIQGATRKFGVRCVGVDYIQCVRGGRRKSGDGSSRRIVIMDAASEWGTAAQEVGSHLILSSQLNTRDPTIRPTKSNLKECGDLEEMAEYVMLLHRLNNTQTTEGTTGFSARNDVDLIIDKNKTGACGVIPLEFDTARACFTTRTPKD